MKKIILIVLTLILSSQIFTWISYAASMAPNKCWEIWKDINDKDLSSLLKDCQPDNTMEGKNKKELLNLWWLVSISVSSNEWYALENATGKILFLTKKLITLASILAIWWIVFAAIMLVTAYWDDAKHKKWKDIIKWSILWFVVSIISMQLINAVINLIYWISWK